MEEVKRKRGRPKKVHVEKQVKEDDPINGQLGPAGGTFEVGEISAYVLGTEIFYFRVEERVEQPGGSIWLKGHSGLNGLIYVPEQHCRRRRDTIHHHSV
jgi:hypothetical protein